MAGVGDPVAADRHARTRASPAGKRLPYPRPGVRAGGKGQSACLGGAARQDRRVPDDKQLKYHEPHHQNDRNGPEKLDARLSPLRPHRRGPPRDEAADRETGVRQA
jgi:hypothetical protein